MSARWPIGTGLLVAPFSAREAAVQRLDAHYLYNVGTQVYPLSTLHQNMTRGDAYFTIVVAESAVELLIERSIFRLRTSLAAGRNLVAALRTFRESSGEMGTTIGYVELYNISSSYTAFAAILGAELSLLDVYLVSKKGGFDTTDLIFNAAAFFPADLVPKVPESLDDLQQATKCLAYELPTACGFHLHRATESVLRRYYDAVTGGKPRPKGRNIGDYLVALEQHGAGEAKLKTSLRDLKDLHRNPLIHPEHSLESVDEAISLLGIVRTVVTEMLKQIPSPPSASAAAIAAVIAAAVPQSAPSEPPPL